MEHGGSLSCTQQRTKEKDLIPHFDFLAISPSPEDAIDLTSTETEFGS